MPNGGNFSAIGGFRFFLRHRLRRFPVLPKYAGKSPMAMQYGGTAFGGPGDTKLWR